MPWSFGVGACALIELPYPLPYTVWLKERDLFPHSYEDKKSKNKVLTGECSEVTLLLTVFPCGPPSDGGVPHISTFHLCISIPYTVLGLTPMAL